MNFEDYSCDEIKLLLPNKGGRPKKTVNEKIKYVKWDKKQKELLLELFDENDKRTDFNYIQDILKLYGNIPTTKQINHWFKNQRRKRKLLSKLN